LVLAYNFTKSDGKTSQESNIAAETSGNKSRIVIKEMQEMFLAKDSLDTSDWISVDDNLPAPIPLGTRLMDKSVRFRAWCSMDGENWWERYVYYREVEAEDGSVRCVWEDSELVGVSPYSDKLLVSHYQPVSNPPVGYLLDRK